MISKLPYKLFIFLALVAAVFACSMFYFENKKIRDYYRPEQFRKQSIKIRNSIWTVTDIELEGKNYTVYESVHRAFIIPKDN